ncbi:MAG TPA: UDP-N-acetylenolpyruvoylglucosamine reductase [candidate division Zixibacteria bacterium]|nr:UDP-N-acetylenolpyruvoylglucosamine reductase [candidate division Zixibacteria bacterium]HBZ00893.1 UDP-N-acetylenolpyruvoylglucosamine reductase [candidate division Zixibacteria bacterium]
MIFDSLNKMLDGKVERNVMLAPYTSFSIGGPARFFFVAKNPTEIIRSVRAARDLGLKFFILGGGSNILFDDLGYTGLIIKDECSRFAVLPDGISGQSGAVVDKMVDAALEAGLAGLEYAAGIRGTIGGAVYGNAGAFGHAINEILHSAVLYTHGGIISVVDNNHFKFAYRKSSLSDLGDVVLSVRLTLKTGNRQELADIINERRKFRRERHPVGMGSAGSVFKNLRKLEEPTNVIPAGKILEEAGVRGMRVGDAAVFEKHCNIVVNLGRATSSDIKTLVAQMEAAARAKLGVDLKREILYIDP